MEPNESLSKQLKDLRTLSEEEKLELFKVEELEGRLETDWNFGCQPPDIINNGCEVTNFDCNPTDDGCILLP